MSSNQQEEPQPGQSKFDYLKAKYIFRYPFTFTSIKWALILGSFLGLHSFIRTRNIKKAFQNIVYGSFFLSFPIWAFFMTKYNFYESSIQDFQTQESNKIKNIQLYKRYVQYKLALPSNHSLTEEQLMHTYEQYLKDNFDKNCSLDILLEKVDSKSFDIC